MIEWIKSEDQLPKVGERVLAYIGRYSFVSLGQISDELGEDDEPLWILDNGDDSYECMYPIEYWAKFNYPKINE